MDQKKYKDSHHSRELTKADQHVLGQRINVPSILLGPNTLCLTWPDCGHLPIALSRLTLACSDCSLPHRRTFLKYKAKHFALLLKSPPKCKTVNHDLVHVSLFIPHLLSLYFASPRNMALFIFLLPRILAHALSSVSNALLCIMLFPG